MRALGGFEGKLLKPLVLFMYNRVMKEALCSGGGILYYPNTLTPDSSAKNVSLQLYLQRGK